MQTENEFYLEKPKMLGVRGYSLLLPAIASSIGFFCFAVLGFSFTELTTLPQSFRTWLVLTGSFTLAFGAEVGTLAAVTDIFRKGEKVRGWDAVTLAISILATFAAFILAFASLLGANANWSEAVKLYGPIALGLLAALDSYGGFLEFGLYLNSYDVRLKKYEESLRWHKQKEFEQSEAARFALREKELEAKLAELEAKLDAKKGQGQGQGNVSFAQTDSEKPSIEKANDVRLDGKKQRVNKMLALYSENPNLTQGEVAEVIGVSRPTVSNYLSECESQGYVKRNGQGVEVLTIGGQK